MGTLRVMAHKVLGGSQIGLGNVTIFVLLNSSKVATPGLGFALIFESLTEGSISSLIINFDSEFES